MSCQRLLTVFNSCEYLFVTSWMQTKWTISAGGYNHIDTTKF